MRRLIYYRWLVDRSLTSHQRLRSYGDGTSVYSFIRQTGDTPGSNLRPLVYKEVSVYYRAVPPPRGRAGDTCIRGNERVFDQSLDTAVRGKYPGFALYRKKGPWNEKIADCGNGLNDDQPPQGGAFSRDLLQAKVKVPAIPRGWGPWL